MRTATRWIPAGLIALIALGMIVHGPIAQYADYHRFADTRPGWGIPNAGDVLSNLAFAAAGLWGLLAMRGRRFPAGYRLFAGSLVLTALGSGYYHLSPDNSRLLWDRLPIALACAGLLAAVHEETHRPGRPRLVLAVLAAAAVASVFWWSVTDRMGAGDLRPYIVVQGAPLLLIPIWQALYRSPRPERVAFGIAIGLYVLAKVAELNDRAILDVLIVSSGHTLKHLLAAAAGAVIVAELAARHNRSQ